MFTDRFVEMPSSSSHDSSHVTAYSHLTSDVHQHRTAPTPTSTSGITPSAVVHRMRSASSQYQVEPFVMPDEDGRSPNKVRSPTSPTMHEGQRHGGTVTTPRSEVASSPSHPSSHVYVLHHDSNIPPVTIFHENGTEVVELPPRYLEGTSQSEMTDTNHSRCDASSDNSHPLAPQPRRPTRARKPPRPS